MVKNRLQMVETQESLNITQLQLGRIGHFLIGECPIKSRSQLSKGKYQK